MAHVRKFHLFPKHKWNKVPLVPNNSVTRATCQVTLVLAQKRKKTLRLKAPYESSPPCICYESFICMPWLKCNLTSCVSYTFVGNKWNLTSCKFHLLHQNASVGPWFFLFFLLLCRHRDSWASPEIKWGTHTGCVHMNESWHTCEWVLSLIWMSHVTHVNESCHTCEWFLSLIWMSHVTHVNESCHTCEWVLSLIWMSHDTHANESCHTHERVMSHMWMSHSTHVNELRHITSTRLVEDGDLQLAMSESCHTCEWVMSHIW